VKNNTAPHTTIPQTDLQVHDFEPARERFLDAAVRGLSCSPKTLPTAFLYDPRGSDLFEQICELPEYYPTRTELAIMDRHLDEMAAVLGPDVHLIEYGSGAGIKTRHLLQALHSPVAYAPVDISRDFLMASAAQLAGEFPKLEVLPVCADFTQPFDVPNPARRARRRVLYFPGSTIGNFRHDAAARLLAQMADEVGSSGAILIGVDLVKDVETLEAAYNDAQGITAQFNLNLLRRMNDELGCTFDLDAFEHRALWVPDRGAIEMRLYARRAQSVRVGSCRFDFEPGEWIHTEDSHKYTPEQFAALAARAGLRVHTVWTDERSLFSVQYLVR
jgi:dimethylhistidine N-methyltransferase